MKIGLLGYQYNRISIARKYYEDVDLLTEELEKCYADKYTSNTMDGLKESDIYLSIIGTSGRNADPNSSKLTATLFESMVKSAGEIILKECGSQSNVILVSGGAPWADHVAVSLFLRDHERYKGLKIYAPCPFEGDKYKDSGVVDFRTNPGGTLNYYFKPFSKKCGRDMLLDISRAIDLGAVIDTSGRGFKDRNSKIAKSDIIIAYTWGKFDPSSGGTADTWSKISDRSKKIHVSLSTM
jgi:DNA helicase II / ATP-dependent DNA helicase PcrA